MEKGPRAVGKRRREISSYRKIPDNNLQVNVNGGGAATTFRDKVKRNTKTMKKVLNNTLNATDDAPFFGSDEDREIYYIEDK